MRSIEDILRTYNIVNSRSGSRYTLRFTGALLLAGVFIVAVFMLVAGGPDRAQGPDGFSGASEGSGAAGPGAEDLPFAPIVEEGPEDVYVGYPLAHYDPAQKERYDRDTVNAALLEWLAAHPETPVEVPYEAVYDPAGDGILMGYRLTLLESPPLP